LPVGKPCAWMCNATAGGSPCRPRSRRQPKEIDGQRLDPRLTGATFTELPERYRQQGLRGVIVAKVAPGSRASRNELDGGDLVLAINVARWRT